MINKNLFGVKYDFVKKILGYENKIQAIVKFWEKSSNIGTEIHNQIERDIIYEHLTLINPTFKNINLTTHTSVQSKQVIEFFDSKNCGVPNIRYIRLNKEL